VKNLLKKNPWIKKLSMKKKIRIFLNSEKVFFIVWKIIFDNFLKNLHRQGKSRKIDKKEIEQSFKTNIKHFHEKNFYH
jgi:hypothetical protein